MFERVSLFVPFIVGLMPWAYQREWLRLIEWLLNGHWGARACTFRFDLAKDLIDSTLDSCRFSTHSLALHSQMFRMQMCCIANNHRVSRRKWYTSAVWKGNSKGQCFKVWLDRLVQLKTPANKASLFLSETSMPTLDPILETIFRWKSEYFNSWASLKTFSSFGFYELLSTRGFCCLNFKVDLVVRIRVHLFLICVWGKPRSPCTCVDLFHVPCHLVRFMHSITKCTEMLILTPPILWLICLSFSWVDGHWPHSFIWSETFIRCSVFWHRDLCGFGWHTNAWKSRATTQAVQTVQVGSSHTFRVRGVTERENDTNCTLKW